MRVVILIGTIIISCYGLYGQDAASMLAAVKNAFKAKNQKISVFMELRKEGKVIDKSSYKYYMDDERYFVQIDKLFYLKQQGLHVSVDEYSNEIVIAQSKRGKNEEQYLGNFELLDNVSAPLWKVEKQQEKWYMFIPDEGKLKTPKAEIYFNADYKPILIKLPFPEMVEDNGNVVKADIYFKIEYNPTFSIPNIEDWLVGSKNNFRGKGKYKAFAVTYINE